jgi:hypothetical protein
MNQNTQNVQEYRKHLVDNIAEWSKSTDKASTVAAGVLTASLENLDRLFPNKTAPSLESAATAWDNIGLVLDQMWDKAFDRHKINGFVGEINENMQVIKSALFLDCPMCEMPPKPDLSPKHFGHGVEQEQDRREWSKTHDMNHGVKEWLDEHEYDVVN